jgi:hypothetical protein
VSFKFSLKSEEELLEKPIVSLVKRRCPNSSAFSPLALGHPVKSYFLSFRFHMSSTIIVRLQFFFMGACFQDLVFLVFYSTILTFSSEFVNKRESDSLWNISDCTCRVVLK